MSALVLGVLDALYLWPLAFLLRPGRAGASALERAAHLADASSCRTGAVIAWFALAMVLLQFVVVVMRNAFGLGSIAMQEGVLYLNAALFLLAAAYTLFRDGHVRVDLFYRTASERRRALTDFLGTYVFLLPVMNAVWLLSLPYVRISWSVLEGSRETSGIPAVYLLKTLILVFAVLLLVQGFGLAARTALRLKGLSGEGAPARAAL